MASTPFSNRRVYLSGPKGAKQAQILLESVLFGSPQRYSGYGEVAEYLDGEQHKDDSGEYLTVNSERWDIVEDRRTGRQRQDRIPQTVRNLTVVEIQETYPVELGGLDPNVRVHAIWRYLSEATKKVLCG